MAIRAQGWQEVPRSWVEVAYKSLMPVHVSRHRICSHVGYGIRERLPIEGRVCLEVMQQGAHMHLAFLPEQEQTLVTELYQSIQFARLVSAALLKRLSASISSVAALGHLTTHFLDCVQSASCYLM